MKAEAIHKQGYLFKQGSYLPTWNERYFSLETSLFKQFTDSETHVPSYSVYLGSACVSGIFSASENEELGYGLLWSFVIRWPLPASPDVLEEQWGYMHIGSYDEKEAEEWFDSVQSLIRIEQTKRIVMSSRFFRDAANRTPPDFLPIPSGNPVSRLVFSDTVSQSLSQRFSESYMNLIYAYNQGLNRWKLVNSSKGSLRKILDNENVWKFSVAISRDIASPQKIWETLFNPDANAWEPLVKNSYAITEHSISDGLDRISDTWTFHSRMMDSEITLKLDRKGFRDGPTGFPFILGLPSEQKNNAPGISSFDWTIAPVSESTSIVSVFVNFLPGCRTQEKLVHAIVQPSVNRLREFILCH